MMKLAILPAILLSSGVLAAPTQQPHTAPEKRQWSDINAFLALVVQLFPVNVAVEDVDNTISDAELALATAFDIDTTENDLADGSCADITIIFARGTTETGNVGALVGPPFFDAVESQAGTGETVAVQGVDYPADIPGFLAGGDAAGSQTM
jgi:hypothetical protein